MDLDFGVMREQTSCLSAGWDVICLDTFGTQEEAAKAKEEIKHALLVVKKLKEELVEEEKTFKQMGDLLKKYMDEGNISAGNLIFSQLESQYNHLKKLRQMLRFDVKPIIEEIKAKWD